MNFFIELLDKQENKLDYTLKKREDNKSSLTYLKLFFHNFINLVSM